MILTRFLTIAVLASLTATIPVWANSTDIADLPHVEMLVTVDGILDEDAWNSALQVEIDIETRPAENTPAKVKTTAYLMEDGRNLYVAFDARDPDPSKIRAYFRDRDTAFRDDYVGIVIDSYNDERRAFEFFSNPLGSQMDLTQDDVNGREDDSWDAIWDSAGRITDTGYVVEMRIPLKQLRFERLDGKLTWGIDLLRMYPRENRYRFGSNAMDREVNCYLCQLEKYRGFENADPGRDLEIVPTVTAIRTDMRDDPSVDPLVNGDIESEAGLNLRWGITPDLTANLAINPDFSQVEADVAQLDVNNQFALFFPEKRPFFLEGSDYFRSPIRAIFTRTVADPSVGVKLTGKRGNNTFGFYVAEDDITNLIFPGSTGSDSDSLSSSNTAIVGRYSRSFGDASSVGALLTTRTGDGYYNYVGGFDVRWRINDQHNFRAQILRSDTEYPDQVALDYSQPLEAFSGTAAQASYSYDSRNWYAFASYQLRDENFRADSGFVTRVDYEQKTIGTGRRWYGEESDWWTRMAFNTDYDISHDMDGQLLERELEAYFSVNGPMQSFVRIGGLTRDVFFDGVLFKENKISISGVIEPRGGLSFDIWARVGDQIDFSNTRLGDQLRVQPSFGWNVSKHFLVRLRSSFVKLDSKEGPNIFDAQVHDLRLTWQFSNRSFIRVTTQQQDVKRNPEMYTFAVDAKSRNVGRQLLYSYKLNPQTVFFLGYSDRHIEDDDIDSLTATDRTFFLKLGYAWTP